MTDCVFCQIVAGQSPADIVYRDKRVIAFRDIRPRSPVHILIVPIRHISGLNDLEPEDESLAGHLLLVARLVAEQENIAQSGYRVVINTGRNSGQIVFHLHAHVLGGGPMRHPMG